MNKSWYCTHTYIAEWWPITMLRVIWNPLALCIVSLFCFGNSEALLWQVNVLSFDIDMEERKEKRELISGQQKRFFSSILSEFPVLRCLISRGFFAFQYRTGTGGRRGANSAPNMEKYCKKELMDKCKRGAITLDPFSTNALVLLSNFLLRTFLYSNCIFNAQKPNEGRPLKQNF